MLAINTDYKSSIENPEPSLKRIAEAGFHRFIGAIISDPTMFILKMRSHRSLLGCDPTGFLSTIYMPRLARKIIIMPTTKTSAWPGWNW